jgi:hypothetical protein
MNQKLNDVKKNADDNDIKLPGDPTAQLVELVDTVSGKLWDEDLFKLRKLLFGKKILLYNYSKANNFFLNSGCFHLFSKPLKIRNFTPSVWCLPFVKQI